LHLTAIPPTRQCLAERVVAREPDMKLMERALAILEENGLRAFEIAREVLLQEEAIAGSVYDALRYFVEESWFDVQHPALSVLACKAVGGNPENVNQVAASIVLLAGAADIHDDIVDRSKAKGSRTTVLGRFGENVALLAGDALLFKGLILASNACNALPENQRGGILELIKRAFFQIGSAEAREVTLRGTYELRPEEYHDLIEAKAAVSEMSAHIGAVLGGADSEKIGILRHYGRTLGILMTIRDDFIDMFEPDELKNRAENECLPLPILYALQDTARKDRVIQILSRPTIGEQDIKEMLDLVMESKEVKALIEWMKLRIIQEEITLERLNEHGSSTFKLLLRATLEDL